MYPDSELQNLSTEMLLELSRREKTAGVKPDEDLDIFMKVKLFIMVTYIYCSFEVVPTNF